MKLIKHSKQEIAMQHLNLALAEYVKGVNLYSVLHLAGAAEEILGNLVKLKGKRNSLAQDVDLRQSYWNITGRSVNEKEDRDHILKSKNGIKHLNSEKDIELEMDIEYETKETIRRALGNYNQLKIPISPEILAYHQYERNKNNNIDLDAPSN